MTYTKFSYIMENVDIVSKMNKNTKVSIVKERLKLFDRSHTDNNRYEKLGNTFTAAENASGLLRQKRRSTQRSDASESCIYSPTATSSGYFSSNSDAEVTSMHNVFDDTDALSSPILDNTNQQVNNSDKCKPHWVTSTGPMDQKTNEITVAVKENFAKQREDLENSPLTEDGFKDNDISAGCEHEEAIYENLARGNASKELKERYNIFQEDLSHTHLIYGDKFADIGHSVNKTNDDSPSEHTDRPPPLPPRLPYKAQLKIPTFPEGTL